MSSGSATPAAMAPARWSPGCGSGSSCSRSGALHDLERPHHLVGGVLEHVAVPDVAPGVALEPDDDPRDRLGVRLHGVLPAELGRLGEDRRADELPLALEPER